MSCVVVDPHAEPVSLNPTARTGVLLVHGFTGSPASLRPWAEFLAAQGFRVELPRLPGHGTDWHEMALTEWTDWYHTVESTWRELDCSCDQVFVAGLSMGGALALRLAEEHEVAGVILVNPAIASDQASFRLLGVLKHLRGSIRSIGNDIALAGADEHAYPRTPLAAAHSMTRLWQAVRGDLSRIDADVLLFTSTVDHVVDSSSARLLERALAHLERVELPHSFHVATLDHDAGLIEECSLEFIRSHGAQGSR